MAAEVLSSGKALITLEKMANISNQKLTSGTMAQTPETKL
jgi:hypothetical protein